MKHRYLIGLIAMLISLTVTGQTEETEESEGDEFWSLEDLAEAFFWDFNTPIRTETVAEGLYVLFGVGGNIVVSIGESGVLVVDDQFPEMIAKVNEAIAEVGGGAVDFAINTHWHFDHADGNKALGPTGTWIVAHEHSAEMMGKDNIVNLIMAKYKQEAYPPKARPVISFTDRMKFHFNGGDIELIHAGHAHTAGDLVAIFKAHNAIHFGDVFNHIGFPFIDADNGGSIDGMIRFCEAIYAEIDDETIVIPGHGEIATRADVATYIEMLKTARNRVQALIDEGKSLTEVEEAGVTKDFGEKYANEGAARGFVNRVYTSLRN